jgi:hypothetical protein
MTKRATTGKTEQDRIYAAVQTWQACPWLHPLTCRKDSAHAALEPRMDGERVILVCPDCDYQQFDIPEIVTDKSTVVPAVDLDFKETLTRLLQVKPDKSRTKG